MSGTDDDDSGVGPEPAWDEPTTAQDPSEFLPDQEVLAWSAKGETREESEDFDNGDAPYDGSASSEVEQDWARTQDDIEPSLPPSFPTSLDIDVPEGLDAPQPPASPSTALRRRASDEGSENPPPSAEDDLLAQRTVEDPFEQAERAQRSARATNTGSKDGLSPTADLADLSPDDTGSDDASEKPKAPGTLLLEGSHDPSDPAGLGPAFPNTGEMSSLASRKAAEDDMPTSSRPGLDQRYRGDELPAVSGAGSSAREDDAWAGFDDSGGWHTLTGESQVALVDAVVEGPSEGGGYVKRDTNVYGPGKKPAAVEGARLIGVAGADTGREHSIASDALLIGRSSRCDIVLAEPSVSRRHARIVRRGRDYWVVDLESGNGTYVNGARISEQTLKSGDEVTFGNGTFRFMEIGDVFKPVDASGAPVLPDAQPRGVPGQRMSSTNKAIAVSVAMIVLTFIVAGVVWSLRSAAKEEEERLKYAFGAYLAGVRSFKDSEWKNAENHFNKALKDDPEHIRSHRYLDAVRRERKAEETLAKAKAAERGGDLATAYRLALQVSDSYYYGSDARTLIEGIDRVVDKRLARARAAASIGDKPAVLNALEGLVDFDSFRPEIVELRVSVGAKRETPEEAPNSKPNRKKKSLDDADASPPRSTMAPSNGVDGALAAFGEGDGAKALESLKGLDDQEARVLRAKITKFLDIYQAALLEHRSKRAQSAISSLNRALAFESKITGGRSAYSKEIEKKLADAYYLAGIEEFTAGTFPEAYRAFRKALSFDPGHEGALRMMARLVTKAERIIEQAEQVLLRDKSQANALYKEAAKMVPTDQPAYQQAKRGIARSR